MLNQLMKSNLITNKKGAVAIITVLALGIIALVLIFSLDLSRGQREKTKVQGASDAAALAAADFIVKAKLNDKAVKNDAQWLGYIPPQDSIKAAAQATWNANQDPNLVNTVSLITYGTSYYKDNKDGSGTVGIHACTMTKSTGMAQDHDLNSCDDSYAQFTLQPSLKNIEAAFTIDLSGSMADTVSGSTTEIDLLTGAINNIFTKYYVSTTAAQNNNLTASLTPFSNFASIYAPTDKTHPGTSYAKLLTTTPSTTAAPCYSGGGNIGSCGELFPYQAISLTDNDFTDFDGITAFSSAPFHHYQAKIAVNSGYDYILERNNPALKNSWPYNFPGFYSGTLGVCGFKLSDAMVSKAYGYTQFPATNIQPLTNDVTLLKKMTSAAATNVETPVSGQNFAYWNNKVGGTSGLSGMMTAWLTLAPNMHGKWVHKSAYETSQSSIMDRTNLPDAAVNSTTIRKILIHFTDGNNAATGVNNADGHGGPDYDIFLRNTHPLYESDSGNYYTNIQDPGPPIKGQNSATGKWCDGPGAAGCCGYDVGDSLHVLDLDIKSSPSDSTSKYNVNQRYYYGTLCQKMRASGVDVYMVIFNGAASPAQAECFASKYAPSSFAPYADYSSWKAAHLLQNVDSGSVYKKFEDIFTNNTTPAPLISLTGGF